MVSLAHLVVRLGGALPRDERWPGARRGIIALQLDPSASHDPFPPGLPIGYPAGTMYFSLGHTDWAATTAGGDDYATDWHVHDCAMLLMPRAGLLRFALDSRGQMEHVLRPGEALVVAAGVGHRTRAGCAGHRT